VRGVSSYQGWKYAWPQHVEMYRKRKRTKTDTSVDTEEIKEQIKQELVVEMRMQNMQMQRCCCHQMMLSPMSNRASPSPTTLKSSCASTDVGLIDGTAELATEVRCDDRTHEDLIGMLTEPTHCGLWITWRGLQYEAALGLVHPEETTLQTVPIHEDCVVVHTVWYRFLPQMVPLLLLLLLLLLLNSHTFHAHIQKIHKIFHPHLLLVLKNRKTCIPTSTRDTKYSIPTTTPTTSSSFSSS
jgi:hypothetical protein